METSKEKLETVETIEQEAQEAPSQVPSFDEIIANMENETHYLLTQTRLLEARTAHAVALEAYNAVAAKAGA